MQVLRLCQAAGLVKLGHVALDDSLNEGLGREGRFAGGGARARGPSRRRLDQGQAGGRARPEQAQPAPTAQRNFTDPESRIMVDAAMKEFVQGYNAQATVDSHAPLIVAWGVTQAAADVGQFVPMLEQAMGNVGQPPAPVTADAGYFSEANLNAPQFAGIEFYIPSDRQPHRRDASAGPSRKGPFSAAIRTKLQTAAGRAAYAGRKTIPEPLVGQIKQVRGFRRFWLRVVGKVRGEWGLIFLTHSLLKLFRARTGLAPV